MKKAVDSKMVEPRKGLKTRVFQQSPFDNKNVVCYNGNMKRIVYYVISCTSDENQAGIFHYSQPYVHESSARKFALQKRERQGDKEGHIAIEKHHEVSRFNSWEVDHDGGGVEQVDYL
jgi:hypothetical protein